MFSSEPPAADLKSCSARRRTVTQQLEDLHKLKGERKPGQKRNHRKVNQAERIKEVRRTARLMLPISHQRLHHQRYVSVARWQPTSDSSKRIPASVRDSLISKTPLRAGCLREWSHSKAGQRRFQLWFMLSSAPRPITFLMLRSKARSLL